MDNNKKAPHVVHDSKSRELTGIKIQQKAPADFLPSKNKKRNFRDFQNENKIISGDTQSQDSKNKKFKKGNIDPILTISKGKIPSNKIESKIKPKVNS